jgi:L-lactate dehydrogenase (cytochrome)
MNGKPHTFGNIAEFAPKAKTPDEFGAWVQQQFDASVTWKDIEWLRARWKGDLVIKGILDAEDARSACDAGADAVIVSNHGGRQLDSVSSTIAILPKIVEAVADRAVVLIDGGVHSGLDVTKALALGASGTMMGRPWLYAIAARGQVGLEALLGTYHREMTVAMALTGTPTIADLNAECIQR